MSTATTAGQRRWKYTSTYPTARIQKISQR